MYLRILIILLILNCKTYNFVHKESGPVKEFNSRYKIVSFGFYPMKSRESHVSSSTKRKRYKVTTMLNTNRNLKKLVSFAIPVEKNTSTSLNESISDENVKEFTDRYLSETKGTGYLEIDKLFEKTPTTDGRYKYRMKYVNTDYFLVGYLNKPFEPDSITMKGYILSAITVNFSLFSLGVIPILTEKNVYTRFDLYDKKLNRIDSKELQTNFYSIYSWWVFENKECENENQLEFFSSCSLFSKEIPNYIYETEINKLTRWLETVLD